MRILTRQEWKELPIQLAYKASLIESDLRSSSIFKNWEKHIKKKLEWEQIFEINLISTLISQMEKLMSKW